MAILTPYLFPLLIEFAVMSSTMCLAIWENCGVGLFKPSFCKIGAEGVDDAPQIYSIKSVKVVHQSIRAGSAVVCADATIKEEDSKDKPEPKHEKVIVDTPSHYYNNNIGFVTGWLVVLGTIVGVIVLLYFIYSGINISAVEPISYASNCGISILCTIAIPITMTSMSKLTFKDEEIRELRAKLGHGRKKSDSFKGIHRALDKKLMFNTYLCMMVFKVLSMIAAYEENAPLIFIDGLVCIIMGFLQVVFVNFYASQKRSTTLHDRKTKPGRQGLEFLRWANFALWLINTFLLKNAVAKQVQYSTFGTTAWAITSNIFQPLAILFYFHSMVCIADIIAHSYSAKYIGLKRPSKQNYSGSKSEIKDTMNTSF